MRLRILLRGGHKKDCRGRVCLPENTRAAVSTDISVSAFGRANPAPTIIISICVICGEKLSLPSAARGAFPLPAEPAAADLPCAEEGYDYQYQDDDAAIQVVALDAAPYFEHIYRLVAEIAYHGATLYYAAVRILGGAEVDLRCFGPD